MFCIITGTYLMMRQLTITVTGRCRVIYLLWLRREVDCGYYYTDKLCLWQDEQKDY